MTETVPSERLPSAGVLRRLGAMFYDLLLVLAVMMVVTAAFLPLTGGEAITSGRYGAWEYAYRVLLLAIVILFFGLFWTRRGQTRGMAAWRLRLEEQAKQHGQYRVKFLAATSVSSSLTRKNSSSGGE